MLGGISIVRGSSAGYGECSVHLCVGEGQGF